MISCLPTRQTAEFRQMKKAADPIVVISPYLEVSAFDFREKTPDSALTEWNRALITSVTNQVLSPKCALKHIEMSDLYRDNFLAMYYDFDHLSGANKSIKRHTFFHALGAVEHNEIALFISFHAEYNSATTAITGNAMIGASPVRPTSAAKLRSDIGLMVFNLQTMT